MLGLLCPAVLADEPLQLSLRFQRSVAVTPQQSSSYARLERAERWNPSETAVIVCDVWDRHHCLNAVRRMEEFLPRMNELLATCRDRGAVIIHSPSDCMPAYTKNPARQRAIRMAPVADERGDLSFWCSAIPAEEQAVYPIDQSDGGEDDDPAEHAEWAAKLAAEGRNPALPWQAQHELINIDSERDYISDRGDEVYRILTARGIRNVILLGVHTNMCVLGRPFGLRQQVRSGLNVVLMRDLTDSMYNPRRWPWVDHFTGHELIISHVERFVCPTITSDQILGGEPHRSAMDGRTRFDVMQLDRIDQSDDSDRRGHWAATAIPASPDSVPKTNDKEPIWIRCTVHTPADWLSEPVQLSTPAAGPLQCWVNGQEARRSAAGLFLMPADVLLPDGVNLLVLKSERPFADSLLSGEPVLRSGSRRLSLAGRWQLRAGNDTSWSGIPLPAQFGLGPDVLFQPGGKN